MPKFFAELIGVTTTGSMAAAAQDHSAVEKSRKRRPVRHQAQQTDRGTGTDERKASSGSFVEQGIACASNAEDLLRQCPLPERASCGGMTDFEIVTSTQFYHVIAEFLNGLLDLTGFNHRRALYQILAVLLVSTRHCRSITPTIPSPRAGGSAESLWPRTVVCARQGNLCRRAARGPDQGTDLQELRRWRQQCEYRNTWATARGGWPTVTGDSALDLQSVESTPTRARSSALWILSCTKAICGSRE